MAAEADIHRRAVPGRHRRVQHRTVFSRFLGKTAHRLGWGVVDQAVSSLTNFAVVLYAARTVDVRQFGAFSLAYTTYGFVLVASRGLAAGPLQVRFSGTDLAGWRAGTANSTGSAAATGLIAGLGALIVALALGGTVGAAFIALALTLPGLLLQDSWRYAFFTQGRGSQAFLNDLIWGLALLPAIVFLRMSHSHQVFWFVLAWGATAYAGAVAGIWQARVMPSLARAWGWVRQHGDLGVRYLAENTFINAASQLRTYTVAVIVGLAAAGYFQAANTLMGPFMVIFYGMTLVTVPEAVRILHRSPRHLWLFCLIASAGLSALCLAWGGVLLVALPRGLGGWLIGQIWRPTYPLILPMTLTFVGACASAGATTGLHGLGAARRSLLASFLASAACLIGGVAGPLIDGMAGAAWGMAIGMWIGTLVWWWEMRVALREFDANPTAQREVAQPG